MSAFIDTCAMLLSRKMHDVSCSTGACSFAMRALAAGDELLGRIFSLLSARDLAQAEATCVQWYVLPYTNATAFMCTSYFSTRLVCNRSQVVDSFKFWQKLTETTWEGQRVLGASVPAVAQGAILPQQQWKHNYINYLVSTELVVNLKKILLQIKLLCIKCWISCHTMSA